MLSPFVQKSGHAARQLQSMVRVGGVPLVLHRTNECEIGKRSARLEEALGINPDVHKKSWIGRICAC